MVVTVPRVGSNCTISVSAAKEPSNPPKMYALDPSHTALEPAVPVPGRLASIGVARPVVGLYWTIWLITPRSPKPPKTYALDPSHTELVTYRTDGRVASMGVTRPVVGLYCT